MERAKRLELIREIFDSFQSEAVCESTVSSGAQGDALDKKTTATIEIIQRQCEEMHELFEGWRNLEPGVKTGVLAIVKSKK